MSDYPYIGNGLQTFQPQVQTQPRVWTWLILLLVAAFAVFLAALVKSKGLVKHGFSFAFIAFFGGRRVTLHLTTGMEIAHQPEDEDEENEEEGEKKEGKNVADLVQKKMGLRLARSYPALDGLLRKDSSFSCLLGTEMFLCIEKPSPFHPSRSIPSLCFSPLQETRNLPCVLREITQKFPDDSVNFWCTPWPSLESLGKPLISGWRDLLPLPGSFASQPPTFEQQFGFNRTLPWEKSSIPPPPPFFSPLLKVSSNQRKLLRLFNISIDPVTTLNLAPPANQASIGLTDGSILLWDVEKATTISRAVSVVESPPISALLRNKQEKRSIISGKMGIVEQWDERITTQPVSSWALFASHRDGAIRSIISKGGQELICTSNNSISYKLDLRMAKHKPIEVFRNGKLLLDGHSLLDVLDSLLFLLPHDKDEDEDDCTCETQEQIKPFALPNESKSFLSRCVKAVRSLSFEHHRS